MPTRRTMMLTAAALPAILPFAAQAAGDVYPTDTGQIVIHPVNHASFVMETPDGVIYNDPVGDASAYSAFPPPDLILITHEHGDHFSPDTLLALAVADTQLITNPAVRGMLPDALIEQATALKNGEAVEVTLPNGNVGITAVPAYNTTPDRLKYHPQGRDNGYVLTIDGRKVYIAGDTEDIPEMRAQTGIDVAFVPMNLPYTMTVEQAADAVNAFQPKVVYPYHYKGSDPQAFAALVKGPKVVLGNWYGDQPKS